MDILADRTAAQVVACSPDGIITLDAAGAVTSWNPAAQALTGWSPAESTGRPLRLLRAAGPLARALHDVARDGGARGVETALPTRDGGEVEVWVAVAALLDEDGRQVGTSLHVRDVTERTRVARDLARGRDEALAANAAKSAFLATMSHEIRTPMNAVIGMTDLLLDTDLDPDQREFAQTVHDSGENLLAIIDDVLDFSKIESGELELEHATFSLRDCVDSALRLVALPASAKGLELVCHVDLDCPDRVWGDVTRLRQVVANLLSNAVKFTASGEVVVEVRVVELAGPHEPVGLRIAVRDTGIGIPAERLDRLFRAFSQVDSSTTRTYGGTGLGLVISRRLAEAMGGTLEVDSTPGRGSTFTVALRLPQAEQAPHRGEQVLSGRRVLVVDDNESNRRVLRGQLGGWGMTCVDVAAPLDALALLDAGERFDVGVLDMHMPGMDGVHLAAALQRVPAAAELPLVLLTSDQARGDRLRQAVFAAVLSKPVRATALRSALVLALSATAPPPPVAVDRAAASRPLRILLAEDNAVNQKVAELVLAKLGHVVDTVANGEQAVAAVAAGAYDVVLMDVHMPSVDGLTATRRIRAELPADRQPYVVALTANAMLEDRQACEAAGMDAYVAKPVRTEDLRAVLAPAQERAAGRPGPQAPPAVAPGHDGDEAVAAVLRRVDELVGDPRDRHRLVPVLRTLAVQAPLQQVRLQGAAAADDLAVLGEVAHALKGAAATLGVAALTAVCRDLEEAATTGDGARCRALLPALADAVAAGCRAVSRVADALDAGVPAQRASAAPTPVPRG